MSASPSGDEIAAGAAAPVATGRAHHFRTKSAAAAPNKPPTTLADVISWWLAASKAEHAVVVGNVCVVTPWDAIEANLG
jgi:hypothetical protein